MHLNFFTVLREKVASDYHFRIWLRLCNKGASYVLNNWHERRDLLPQRNCCPTFYLITVSPQMQIIQGCSCFQKPNSKCTIGRNEDLKQRWIHYLHKIEDTSWNRIWNLKFLQEDFRIFLKERHDYILRLSATQWNKFYLVVSIVFVASTKLRVCIFQCSKTMANLNI